MIYTGTDLKFFVKATIDGFSMTDDDFRIVIKNRWGQTKYTIEKDECFSDSDGNFYFTIESVSTGSYYAYFTAIIADDDYDKQTRNIVDKQLLYTVDSCGCHIAKTDCGCDDDCECVGIEMVVTNGDTVYPVTTDSQGKVSLTGLSGGCTVDCETHELNVTEFYATGSMTVDISAWVNTFPVGEVRNYNYTGGVQQVDLIPGTYVLQVWGAQGGSGGGYAGGKGGGGGSGYVYTSGTAGNYPSGCLLNSSHYLTDAETKAGNVSFPSTSGGTETGHSGNGYIRITKV